MRFTLTIDLGNDEMQTPGDVASAIDTQVVQRLEGCFEWSSVIPRFGALSMIKDENGNHVGDWVVQ
jgi:hypothetical protein